MNEFGRDVVIASVVYAVLLLVLGAVGRAKKRADTLSDHFLASRSLGFFVILITLFATQYSGNSLSGFPGKTYRAGLPYFMSVTFMVGIVSGYLIFAPRLFARARERSYLTPTDFLADRFRSPALNYISAAIFTLALCNFLIAQLTAMGHAFSGLTEGRIPYEVGVIGGASIILIYELLGGMRAVAWTDVLQGVCLAAGLLIVMVLIVVEVGTPAAIVQKILATQPEKIASPPLRTCLTWLSTFVLLHLGAPLYPQAIQRIYAVAGLRELRRALAIMAALPLVAVSAVVFIGLAGIAVFPGLERIESDAVTFRVLVHLVTENPLAYYPVLIVVMAILAAIMSTADSALLSLASILTKDFFARARGLTRDDSERLTRFAPICSITVLAILVLIARKPITTLWALLEIKFEVLIQLSPAFILGTRHDDDHPSAFRANDILAGLLAGLVVALGLYSQGYRMAGGLHAGVVGVIANYAVVFASRTIRLRQQNSVEQT